MLLLVLLIIDIIIFFIIVFFVSICFGVDFDVEVSWVWDSLFLLLIGGDVLFWVSFVIVDWGVKIVIVLIVLVFFCLIVGWFLVDCSLF